MKMQYFPAEYLAMYDGAGLWLLGGIIAGLGIIGILGMWPGEPFDYDPDKLFEDEWTAQFKADKAVEKKEMPCKKGADTLRNRKRKDTQKQMEIVGDVANDDKLHEEMKRVMERELDAASASVRKEELEKLLGIERTELDKMIAKAKADTLAGVKPERNKSSMIMYFDIFFYVVVGSLLIYGLCQEYDMGLLDVLDSILPTEAAVLREASKKPNPLKMLWSSA